MERSRADRVLADWDRISRQARRPDLPPQTAVTTALPVSTLTGTALLVLVLAAAGVWFGLLPPGVGQPGAQPSPSPAEPSASEVESSSPTLAPSNSPVEPSQSAAGPSAIPSRSWGPLAVVPPQGGTDLLRLEGTLRITDKCVYLEASDGTHLLLWRSNQTTWSTESGAITMENLDGSSVTVSDGDLVVLGGSGGEAGNGESYEDFLGRMDWVVPPAASCPRVRWWGVGVLGY